MPGRYSLPSSLVLSTCLISLIVLSPGRALSLEKVRLATPVPEHPVFVLPILAAEEQGFWTAEGVEVEWHSLRGSSMVFKAATAGELDMGIEISVGYIQAVGRGIPVLLVADLKQSYPFFIWVRADSPIKTPADLKGARIAVTNLGGTSYGHGRLAVKALGIEKEVRFVATGGIANTQAAMKTGVIEATVQTMFAMTPLKLKEEVKEIVAIKDYLPKEWVDLMVWAHQDFLKRGTAIKGTIKGLARATDFISKNPDWSINKIKSHLGYTDQMARFSYGLLSYGKGASVEPKALGNVNNFLVEYGIVPKDKALPIARLYTNEFAK